MTISEALVSLNSYPIPANSIDKILIDRALVGDSDYDTTVGSSQAFRLASADTFMWLSEAPNLVEQEVGVNSAIAIKENLKDKANQIYGEFGDAKFTGKTYGFVGENYNG